MRKVEIEISDDALIEARNLFMHNREFIAMLNRMGSAYKRHDRRFIGCIACTNGEWKRYKDILTRTRSAFIEEYHRDKVILVVLHVLPRTDWTYEIFGWLFDSCLQ